MASVSVRDLDDSVRERLRQRAARNGRSMEAEIRAILTAAVSSPTESMGLARALVSRFGDPGGVDLDLPPRTDLPTRGPPPRVTTGAMARERPVVLDTNVLSELMRPAPERAVLAWALALPPPLVRTTAVTVAEVRFGIARLPTGRRRTTLAAAADELLGTFADRIFAFDVAAADAYGDVVVERERIGAPICVSDAQIAAICRVHGAVLATRDTADFSGLGLDLVDPWAPRPDAS